jgi:hypothetical protein
MSRRQTSRPNVFSRAWSKAFASGSRKAASPRSSRVRPKLENLEDRIVPAVIDVNTLADIPLNQLQQGQVTLRDAIQIANTNGDASNTINLTLPGVYQITLAGTPGETDNQAGELSIFANANANQNGLSLTIQNTSGGSVAVSGNHQSRVFDINPTNAIPANNVLLGTVTISGVTIENGFTTDAANADGPNASGGGIRDQGPVSLTLNNDVITDNAASADGGGVSMENIASTRWTLTLNNTTVSNNHAGDAGGGIDEDGSGKVFVNFSTITGNSSVNQGAGIWLDAVQVGTEFQTANMTVTGSLISGNSAVAANNVGGGLGNAGNGAVTITDSTVANNFSGGVGGGFGDENAQGTLTVVNSTFANNYAIGNGGGIEASGPSTIINDSTITGNTTQAQGGGLNVTSASFTLNNTIVAGNFANNNGGMNFQGIAPDVLAAVSTGSGNFIGIGDANLTGITNGSNGNHIGTAAAPLDPRLGPLQNNGGLTPTEAPLPGSPVLGAGVPGVLPANTPTDQRGFSRIINGTMDIGAVQFQDASLTVSITPASANVLVNNTATFFITVSNTSGQALPADNSVLSIALSSGLTATSPLTFTLAAIPPGQSQVFTVTATATALGTQTISASLTSPDATPNSVFKSTSINVVLPTPAPPPPPTNHTPVGGLTMFGFGFGPTGIDLFEVDSAGDVFAQSFIGSGSPIFLNSALHMPLALVQNGQLLALLTGANGQNFVVEIFNPFNMFVESALIAALTHL